MKYWIAYYGSFFCPFVNNQLQFINIFSISLQSNFLTLAMKDGFICVFLVIVFQQIYRLQWNLLQMLCQLWLTWKWQTGNLSRWHVTSGYFRILLILKVLLYIGWQVSWVSEVRPKIFPHIIDLCPKFLTQVFC